MDNRACEVHRNTPNVSVSDSRGLLVRDLVYSRHPDTPQGTEALVTKHSQDARGYLACSADPLLSRAGVVNVVGRYDLSGNAVRWQSVDGGTCLQLTDTAGQPLLRVAHIATPEMAADDYSQAVTQYWHYELQGLPGRLVAMTEQAAGAPLRCAERRVYAGPDLQHQQRNLAGVSMLHYDTAGQMKILSVALSGVPSGVSRRLMTEADDIGAQVDWQGEEPSAWDEMLVPQQQGHITLSTLDAMGTPLNHEDAAGHVQRMAYDLAGRLAATWLTLQAGAEQAVVKALNYGAAGQKLSEAHGNGLFTRYRFEACSVRLLGIATVREPELKLLLDLAYTYDPAGNVLRVVNAAQATRFWRGQKVEAGNQYVYDSLHQLVRASGREMALARHAFITFDQATYSQYTRTYSYDVGGNLTQIRHRGPATGNNYTTDFTVSDRSNRAVLSALTQNPREVEGMFTAGGQQRLLYPGQRLLWTPRGELQQVSPVTREGADDDFERYRYAGDRQRVLKLTSRETAGARTGQRVVYLPGLELRSTFIGGAQTEAMQIVTMGEPGRAQVRVLRWHVGQPAGVENDQWRFSHDDLSGSCLLETDSKGSVISQEEFYPYGGTAIFTGRSATEASYKSLRYSGKERDVSGLYYYGWRYYQTWAGRWLSADPAGMVDGLNLYRMVRNNPTSAVDPDGKNSQDLATEHANPGSHLEAPPRQLVDMIRETFQVRAREMSLVPNERVIHTDQFTLYRGAAQPKRLKIISHGKPVATPATDGQHVERVFTASANMNFFTENGFMAVVATEQASPNSLESFVKGERPVRERFLRGDNVSNYTLAELAPGKSSSETVKEYERAPFKMKMERMANHNEVDVLLINAPVNVSDVLQSLESRGLHYSSVDNLYCRGARPVRGSRFWRGLVGRLQNWRDGAGPQRAAHR
ncbi:RHS repeat-associated core domain-containing protein [Pseudomonas sp. CC120222-01a]|uniref:RHS repeat-associated core domain-containing protein n=1 Tax=Pseudomonas sp. CC120222-01a TaxID=1378075 RepID=UPI000D9C8ABF|nr:RHS repeat-associated core domain-containing protein [Pseudomonas sp. CC120222-01a]PVZ39606.1 RHS repeat-associated protein [Pseudomonas sp. CC120222-01a]